MKSVIGIDPGSEKSAFVHWNGKEILDKGIHPNEELLELLKLWWVADSPRDIVLAIEEMISIPGGGGKAICSTIWWSGRFYEAWDDGQRKKVPVYVVRKALGAKNDPGIRAVLIQRFGETGTKKNPNPVTYGLQGKGYHLWRAFGLCVAHWDHLAFQAREMK